MRIAFITYEFPPETGKGGIGTYSKQIATMMANIGWDVHVFAGSQQKSGTQNTAGYTLHYVKCENGSEFKDNVTDIFSSCHLEDPFDLMESPEIQGNAWEIKKKFPQIPLIVRLHASNYLVEHLKKKYTPFISKLRYVIGALRLGKLDMGYWRLYDYKNDSDYQFTQTADAIIAPSKIMKQWAVKQWHILPEAIEVISNPFIPSNIFLEIPIAENNANKEIVFFGRLNVLKGLVNCTLAMEKILTKFPNYNFKIIGDDGPGPNTKTSMKDWMQKKLQRVIKRVTFYSGQEYDKLPALISSASIVLIPSLFESFSYTCAEAMAAGKVVIGSNGTGMEDIIVNNFNGILINPECKKEIFKAVEKIILDDHLRYSISQSARISIASAFNAEKLAPQYINYYKKIEALYG